MWTEKRQQQQQNGGRGGISDLDNQSDMLGILSATATSAGTNLQVRPWDKLRGPVVKSDLVTITKCLVATNLQTNANDKRPPVEGGPVKWNAERDEHVRYPKRLLMRQADPP